MSTGSVPGSEAAGEPEKAFTAVERFIDDRARMLLARAPHSRAWKGVVELLVFGLKQGWACIFGAALLALLFATSLWYPQGALARNDFITIGAVVVQVLMVALRLETLRELRVIVLFHLVGTGMELFKTVWAPGFTRVRAICISSGSRCTAGSCMRRWAPIWCACTGCSICASRAILGAG